MKTHPICLALFGLLLIAVDRGCSSKVHNEEMGSLRSHHDKSRPKILFRIHRQAEDSYEEGGDYEYEEEESPGGTEVEEEKATKEPAEGEEYYDGDNYDEKNEEEEVTPEPTDPPTTTTTTTTPEPPQESAEHNEDEDRYEERYEEERRRYEQETMRQLYEQTHGSDNESVEQSLERTPEPEETDDPEEATESPVEITQEEVEEIPTTTLAPEETPENYNEYEEPEENQSEVDQSPEIQKENVTEHRPTEQEEDDSSLVSENGIDRPEQATGEGIPDISKDEEPEEIENVKESMEHKIPSETDSEQVEEDATSLEIEESGRQDLERYTVPTSPSEREEEKDENQGPGATEVDEYNEIEEEEVEEEEPVTTTTTTSTTTTTTPKPQEPEDPYGGRRDPYEYEVEQPSNNVDEDEYYDKEPEPTIPTSTSTTTTPEPPPPSVENEIESEESVEDVGNQEYGGRRPVDVERVDEETRTHHHKENGISQSGEESEMEPTEKLETEEEILRRMTSTTTAEPELESEYEDEDEEDLERYEPIVPTTVPTTTTSTTTTSTTTQAPKIDSLENHIFETSEESIEEISIDHRNQYEVSPTIGGFVDELETVEEGIEEITPKIECFTGYRLSEDGQECLDENECQSQRNGVCGPLQICHNLPGSYKCSCPSGYIVDFRNEKNCRDENECENLNGGCNQDCINTPGSFYCACADDFNLGIDGKSCVRKPTTTTTTTTTSTTTTTTTTPAPTTVKTTPQSVSRLPFIPKHPKKHDDPLGVKNCPTPPVPRGSGIAYLYCSRSPVGIHHRHSQLERRLLQDWAARRNKTQQGGRNNLKYRNRRNLLKRRLRQTTYSPGSMCELRCRPGFQLKGQYTLHCNASDGTWQGTRNGVCHALPKTDNQNLPIGLSHSETTPSNEIPRLAPNEVSGFNQFRPSFVSLPISTSTTTFRPTYSYEPLPRVPLPTRPYVPPTILTTPSTTTTTSSTTPMPTTTTPKPTYWPKPASPQVPSRRPNYYSPSSYSNTFTPVTQSYVPVTTTTYRPITTTSRNSYIHLTYRFKTPWINCPDDIKLDLPPNQNTAYVIIPQPQTNVDWWRQVTAEPAWAKGLETETGPGKQRITFRARTAAPVNNTAECSFTLEVRDNDPPRVRECPESFSTRLNPGQNSKAVTWIEPHFSDNVRITSLKKSHEPGAVLPLGEHLINYEAKDSSDNKARCSLTVTVLPPSGNFQQNNLNRRPVNTEGATKPPNTSPKPEVHSSLRNVVCHVGKKGRRIVFQSRVVPRGCSEMTVDVVGDAAGQGSFNTLNTITQNSAENSATSQISSVSFSSHDHPQQASAFSQSVSNGRNNNRLVHSTSSVTNSDHGTSSKASSYAIAISSSSRNFDLPFLNPDKQVYEEDFVVPTQPVPKTRAGQTREGSGSRSNKNEPLRKYFRHFDTWDTTTDAYRSRERY